MFHTFIIILNLYRCCLRTCRQLVGLLLSRSSFLLDVNVQIVALVHPITIHVDRLVQVVYPHFVRRTAHTARQFSDFALAVHLDLDGVVVSAERAIEHLFELGLFLGGGDFSRTTATHLASLLLLL